jgi:hypothetical protein
MARPFENERLRDITMRHGKYYVLRKLRRNQKSYDLRLSQRWL